MASTSSVYIICFGAVQEKNIHCFNYVKKQLVSQGLAVTEEEHNGERYVAVSAATMDVLLAKVIESVNESKTCLPLLMVFSILINVVFYIKFYYNFFYRQKNFKWLNVWKIPHLYVKWSEGAIGGGGRSWWVWFGLHKTTCLTMIMHLTTICAKQPDFTVFIESWVITRDDVIGNG